MLGVLRSNAADIVTDLLEIKGLGENLPVGWVRICVIDRTNLQAVEKERFALLECPCLGRSIRVSL